MCGRWVFGLECIGVQQASLVQLGVLGRNFSTIYGVGITDMNNPAAEIRSDVIFYCFFCGVNFQPIFGL